MRRQALSRRSLVGFWMAPACAAIALLLLTHAAPAAPPEPDDAEEILVGDEGVADAAPDDDAAAAMEEEADADELLATDDILPPPRPDDGVRTVAFDEPQSGDDSLQPVATEAAPYDADDSVAADRQPLEQPSTTPAPRASANAYSAAKSSPAPAHQGPRGISVEPAQFKGLQPGVSSRADVEGVLGKPKSAADADGQTECTYEVPPFERLVVVFQNDFLASMVIDLKQAFPADLLAKELAFDNIPLVTVLDETGRPLGQSFPERGVLFSLGGEGDTAQVVQIILDSVDAQPFVVRAENTYRQQLGMALADVEQALALDPGYARAHWLRAQILTTAGRPGEALQAAEAALAADPNDLEYRLTYAQSVAASGDHVQAVQHLESILAQTDIPADLQARALLQLGDQLVAGASRDYKQAIDRHMQAIKLAEPLVNDARLATRRHARETLLNGHLAVANDIAWGGWRSKSTVVPQWLERANAIARKLAEDGEAEEYRFRVAKAAMGSLAGFQGRQDIGVWLKDAKSAGEKLIDDAPDNLTRQARQWDLALALYDALQIEHVRGRFDDALANGKQAAEAFEQCVGSRDPVAGQDYMLGRLYFRLGSIEAIHHRDHPAAVAWFDKAAPLIEQPIPESALGDLGRQGETLVSMAVSYWEVGRQDDAVRMTNDGVNLMVQAVNDGIMEETALVVPYHNLSRMHRSLGDEDAAQNFEQLASQSRANKRR